MLHKDFAVAQGRTGLVSEGAADAFVPQTPTQLPLPGVIIFVHGVNSMGEWYNEGEQGLCEGLNQRLARMPDKMKHGTVAGGSMQPNSYQPEINEKGEIIDTTAKRFFSAVDNYSPVIRFRWGYRCGPGELDTFEPEIMLNKDDAWGGGPFQNGTSCLSDLWSEGLNDRLFLSINAQRLNPTSRQIYYTPSRRYMVHAAQRLADLIADIRAAQSSCPVTVVCHSQGNMVGLAAALLAKNPDDVADNYILCNPPYSVEKLFMYNYANRRSSFAEGERQQRLVPTETRTAENRISTLRAVIDRIYARGQVTKGLQPIATVNCAIENKQHGKTFFELCDTADYANGRDRDNRGAVFLYINPQDQVIGSSSIEGIGWKGVTHEQLAQLGPTRFHQRVWAQDFPVGDPAKSSYHYWRDHWNAMGIATDKQNFWYPQAQRVRWLFEQGRYDESAAGKTFAWIVGGLLALGLKFTDAVGSGLRVNNLPADDYEIPLTSLPIPKVDDQYLVPCSTRANTPEGGMVHSRFDEALDDAAALRKEDDSSAKRELLMEDNAMRRMTNSQERKNGKPDWAQSHFDTWFNAAPQNATDHSTILKNPNHSARVLAYDVAVGLAKIPSHKWADWRKKAHWRFVDKKDDPYYSQGFFGDSAGNEESVSDNTSTVQNKYPDASMPVEIADRPARPQDAMAYKPDLVSTRQT